MPIAHYFTFMRILISPVFLLIYLYYDALGISSFALPFILAILLSISELSDAIDGYLARKYNQVTDLGKVLDPMADSIYRISIFLTFTIPPVKIPIGLIFVFLYRDSIISTLRTICALKGFALAARSSGKIKAVIQASSSFIVLLLLFLFSKEIISQAELTLYSTYAIGFAALYTLYSGIDYIVANWSYIKKALLPKEA